MNERERELTERKKREAKEAREARRAAKKKTDGKRNPDASKAGGKKHTITARKVGKFAWQQVKDAALAFGVATYLMYAAPIPSLTCIAIGGATFVAKKLVNAGIRFGKKHIVKKRKKPVKDGKKIRIPKLAAGAITAAGAALPLLLIPNPIALVAAGVSATVLAKITGLVSRIRKVEIEEETEEKHM